MDELKYSKGIPIFALEGAAFAGKTTLLNYLHKNFSGRVITIPEASEYVGGDKNFPSVPFKNLGEAKKSTHFFVEIEKRRSADALRLYEKYHLPIILDRSTLISSLFFYKLLAKSKMQSLLLAKAFYNHALELFRMQVGKGNLIIPSGIIYIAPTSRSVFNARLLRGTKNTVFSEWASFQYLDRLYKALINKCYSSGKSIDLRSDNSSQNLQLLTRGTLVFVETSSPWGIQKNIFDNFDSRLGKIKPCINLANEEIEFQIEIKRASHLMNIANIIENY